MTTEPGGKTRQRPEPKPAAETKTSPATKAEATAPDAEKAQARKTKAEKTKAEKVKAEKVKAEKPPRSELTAKPKKAAGQVPRPKKTKRVRDSFSMPQVEHARLSALKDRTRSLGLRIRKGELVAAGLRALQDLPDPALKLAVMPPGRASAEAPAATGRKRASGVAAA